MTDLSFGIQRADKSTLPDVRRVCETKHYLQRYPDPRSLPFAYVLTVNGQLRIAGKELWGLVVFKKPQHHIQRGLFGYDDLPTAWQVLDMARVWINPKLQGNGFKPGGFDNWTVSMREDGSIYGKKLNVFSRMVSLTLKRVQWDWLEHHPPRFPDRPYHIELVISYCELAHHDGSAYRACSFTSAGKTSDGTKEVYVKHLRAPLKSWENHSFHPVHQLPMFRDVPIKY